MSNLSDKFIALEESVNNAVLERPEEVHTAILALLSRHHHFQVGPPGVAKSFLVEEIMSNIGGLPKDGYFKWLMTKFTVPEELFGGPDFALLRDKGIYKRVTDKKLPTAHFAFIDETFKAGSSILNSLLKIMNEREFDNVDDDPAVPLLSLFGASNELAATNELDALADRFMFWHYVQPVKDISSFMAMLGSDHKRGEKIVTLDEIVTAQAEVAQVVIPDDVKKVLWDLRQKFAEAEITVSDRKFYNSLAVIKAEAWLDGRDQAEISDTKSLQHCFWRDPAQIAPVRKIVLDLADPLEKEALDLLADLNKAYEQYTTALKDSSSRSEKVKASVELVGKLQNVRAEAEVLKQKQETIGRRCAAITRVEKRRKEISAEMSESMGLDMSDS